MSRSRLLLTSLAVLLPMGGSLRAADLKVIELRRQGLGTRTSAADLLVFGPYGPVDNTLRFANEPARHKVLDLVGDLALLGAWPHCEIVAVKSGHQLHAEIARALRAQLPIPSA